MKPEGQPQHLGGLEVLVALNRGGMGQVLLARRRGSHGFERLVAVKVIRPELSSDPAIRSMFLDEARVLQHLDHPAIAQVQDFGEHQERLYLVLEYVPGLSLGRLLKKRGRPVPPPVAARMVAEIARGLHAVHEQRDESGRPLGIVHRDISPQNIMISFTGRMKLLDFGIATIAGRRSPETTTGLVKGKIAYVAPEQISGADVDRRTDVYSLSIVLHELLTGAALYAQRTSPLAAAEDRRRPPRPSRSARVPRALDRIVMRGLAMDPWQRWPDARALAAALEAFSARAGGPSLEAFAETELAQDREAHRAWIRGLSAAGPGMVPPPPAELPEEVEVGSSLIEAAVTAEKPRRRLLFLTLGLGGVALGAVATQSGPIEELVHRIPELGRRLRPSGSSDEPARAPDLWASAPPEAADPMGVERLEATSRPSSDALDPAAPASETSERPDASRTATSPVRASPGSKRPEPEDDVPPTKGHALTSGPVPVDEPEPVRKEPATSRNSARRANASRPTAKEAERNRSRQAAWGKLTFRARRGGWVLIAGRPFGRTPLKAARIRPGRHRIALQRPGDDRPRWSSWITVREGAHVEIELD